RPRLNDRAAVGVVAVDNLPLPNETAVDVIAGGAFKNGVAAAGRHKREIAGIREVGRQRVNAPKPTARKGNYAPNAGRKAAGGRDGADGAGGEVERDN